MPIFRAVDQALKDILEAVMAGEKPCVVTAESTSGASHRPCPRPVLCPRPAVNQPVSTPSTSPTQSPSTSAVNQPVTYSPAAVPEYLDAGEESFKENLHVKQIISKGRPKLKSRVFSVMGLRKRKREAIAPDHEILAEIVDAALLPSVLSCQRKISEDMIECIPANVSNAVEGCEESRLRKYFDEDGFSALQALLKHKRKVLWSCKICHKMDDGSLKMVQCRECYQWYHFECVNLRTSHQPENIIWQCPKSCTEHV